MKFFYPGKYLGVLILIVGNLFFNSCSTSNYSTPIRNAEFEYKPGSPHVSIKAYANYVEKQPTLTIVSELIPSSLVTTTNNDSVTSSFEIIYEAQKQEAQKDTLLRFTEVKSIIADEHSSLKGNLQLTKSFNLSGSGKYTVWVTVTDLNSNQTTQNRTQIEIPSLDVKETSFSNLILKGSTSGTNDNTFFPITTYTVSRDLRELELEAQLLSGNTADSTVITARLLKFKSDTKPAEPLRSPGYAISILQKNGIDYNEAEEIFRRKRTVQISENPFSYKVRMQVPDIGNYRFILETHPTGTNSANAKAIDFGVKYPHYPHIREPRQMAKSLYYLMDRDAHDDLLSIKDPDSLKKSIDRFWLSNIKNKKKAKQTIELYYSRVEEANKYFSSYKAGWKTDRGMVYILFGPPKFKSTYAKRIRWAYSTDQYDPQTTYFFNETRQKSNIFPFSVYLLDRSNSYLRENEYLIVKKWLNGNILP